MVKIYKESNPISVDFYLFTKTGKKKYIGNFNYKDKTFRKDIQNQHIFHKANSFGVDAGLIDELTKMQCEKVILRYIPTGTRYSITYDQFITKGWTYPREVNTKVQGLFQPSFICHRKWWRERDQYGRVLYEPDEEGGDNNEAECSDAESD